MFSPVYVVLLAAAFSTICGARQLDTTVGSRIINGIQANYSNFPYAMSLQNVSLLSQTTRGHTCGGAMVTLRHAVTSASCLYISSGNAYVLRNATEFRVFAGSHLLTDDISADRWRSVTTFTPHPEYSGPPSVNNNIAIITVTSPFPSGVITPIGVSTSVPADGASCTVAGWGSPGGAATSVSLLYANMQIMNQTVCANASIALGGPAVQSYMLCAAKTTSSSSCTADYGNALVCGGTLTGVLSECRETLSECNMASELEIYTRTANFASWANGVTGAGVTLAPIMGLLLVTVALSKTLVMVL